MDEGGAGDRSDRFGPVDPDDLIGTASARLLAVGVERRARLTALRVLGLLADHAGADLAVRRPPRDLAAEFDISPDDLGEALLALTAVEIVGVDTDLGVLTVAAAAPSRGGLRLESFLANAGRTSEPGAGAAPSADEAGDRTRETIRPPLVLLLGGTGPSDGVPALADDALDAGAPALAGRWRRAISGSTGPAGVDAVGEEAVGEPVSATEVVPLDVGPLPLVSRRRQSRAATAALVAAAAALVLALSPDLEQTSTTRVVNDLAASADRPDRASPDADDPAQAGSRRYGAGSDASSPTTHMTIRGIDGRTSSSPFPGGAGMSSPSVVAPLDSLAPTDVPSAPVGPVAGVGEPDVTPPDEASGAAPPTAGPVVPPCPGLAPVLEVVRTLTDLSEQSVDGAGETQVVTVQGTASNALDEAVVVDRLSVEVTLADGSTRTATTTAPLLLGPSGTATWTVELTVDGEAPTSADAVVLEWSMADGDPTTACPP